MGSSPWGDLCVFWLLGELCCWTHKLLAGSPKRDRWNVKGQMVLHVAGGGMRLITSPYKTICINKHNDCCHMENFEMTKKRVWRHAHTMGSSITNRYERDWTPPSCRTSRTFCPGQSVRKRANVWRGSGEQRPRHGSLPATATREDTRRWNTSSDLRNILNSPVEHLAYAAIFPLGSRDAIT
jgi:hypothetical protein